MGPSTLFALSGAADVLSAPEPRPLRALEPPQAPPTTRARSAGSGRHASPDGASLPAQRMAVLVAGSIVTVLTVWLAEQPVANAVESVASR